MNYSLYNIPYSGERPIVFMDLTINDVPVGRIHIKLFREVFPAAVENFVKIAEGNTYRSERRGVARHRFVKETRRTYADTIFHSNSYNNYLTAGDIYNNTGANAGTIYSDFPIPDYRSEYFYPHERKGMISLVPFLVRAESTEGDKLYFDSTFMILLNDINPTNAELYQGLDAENVVIGYVYSGLDVLDRINDTLAPLAGRTYPRIGISASGTNQSASPKRACGQKKPLCGQRCRLTGRKNIVSINSVCEMAPATVYKPTCPSDISNYRVSAQNIYGTNDVQTIADTIARVKLSCDQPPKNSCGGCTKNNYNGCQKQQEPEYYDNPEEHYSETYEEEEENIDNYSEDLSEHHYEETINQDYNKSDCVECINRPKHSPPHTVQKKSKCNSCDGCRDCKKGGCNGCDSNKPKRPPHRNQAEHNSDRREHPNPVRNIQEHNRNSSCNGCNKGSCNSCNKGSCNGCTSRIQSHHPVKYNNPSKYMNHEELIDDLSDYE